MRIVTVEKYQSTDGHVHDTKEACCEREAQLVFFKLSEMSETDHRGAALLRKLAENWFQVHAALIQINKERCEVPRG